MDKNTNKTTLPAVPQGITWRLAQDPQTSRSGDNGLYVDLQLGTNDFDTLVRAGYALFQQAAEAKVAEALKGKTEAAPEVKQAEQRVAATEKELAKLHRELAELEAAGERLTEGDSKLEGVALATAISQNQTARRAIVEKITGSESGLLAMKQRAAELRRATNKDIMAIAAGIAQDLHGEFRAKRDPVKVRIAAAAGEEYARLEMYERALGRCTEAFVRDIVARMAGISAGEAPPPEQPKVVAPAVPAPATPASTGPGARASWQCAKCEDRGWNLVGGKPVHCECSPPKQKKPRPVPLGVYPAV